MSHYINDLPINEIEIIEACTGPWVATIEAESDKPLTGKITLDIDDEIFEGFVAQSDNELESWKGHVIGGAGGLDKVIAASSYTTPTLKIILDDIMRDSGESLDSTIAADVLSKPLPRWTRFMGATREALQQLADALGMVWRMTRAGKVWIGAETWPELKAKYIEEEYSPEDSKFRIAYENDDERPIVRPGVMLDGRHVHRVVTIAHGDGLRQFVYFGANVADTGLIATIVRKVREVVWPKLHAMRFYPARVVSQNSDGSLDLRMDDEVVAGKFKSVARVPPVFGLPGITIQVQPGAALRLFFDAGSPTRAQAALWDRAARVKEMNIAVSDALRLGSADASDAVALESKVHKAISAMLATGVGTTGADAFAAAKLAWDGAMHTSELGPPLPVGASKVKAE